MIELEKKESNKKVKSKTKVDRKHLGYISFEAKKPRKRNICPDCESLNIQKRVTTGDYKCWRCGWRGTIIKREIIEKK